MAVQVTPAQSLIARLRAATKDLSPVFDGPITNSVHEMFGRIFDTEGAYINQPWAPLRPSTVAIKNRLGRGEMGILRRFNTLWASLVKRSAPQGYRIVRPQSLTIGTSVPYAAKHQQGDPSTHLPQRKIAPSPDEIPAPLLAEWSTLMERYIVKGTL